MTELVVGIRHERDEVEILPTAGIEMSVVGIIGTAPDADEDQWPLNTNVYCTTNMSTELGLLGETGTLPDAVRGIVDQLGVEQRAARMVIRRIEHDDDEDLLIANAVGDSDANTGIYGFTLAPGDLGVTPRIIIVPGLTWQTHATGGDTTVTRAAKSGGNTGNGVMTLATPAYGASVKAGIYEVRCIGGSLGASAVATGGNAGNGTVGSITVDANAKTGAWHLYCVAEASSAGTFVVEDPDGIFFGTATVGVAFSSGTGINFTIADGSNDFEVGDSFAVTVVAVVPTDGGVFSVTDPDDVVLANATVGIAYTSTDIKFTIADGSTDFIVGDGFDVTVAILAADIDANPIVAAAPAVLDRLRAVMIADGPYDTRLNWINWRETIQSDRIIPLASAVRVSQPNGDILVKPASPRIAGIAVRRDHEFGGRPGHSWANQAVRGIVAPNRTIAFSLTDGAVEAQDLIGRNAGVIVRGESGVEDAIAEGGFVFWGTDTCAEDPLWMFYHVLRMRDYIELGQIRTLRFYLGRFNITLQTVTAVLNTMESHLSSLRSRGDILDYRVGFEADKNSPEELRLGQLQVMFRAEEPPVLRRIIISSRRYREALINLTRTISTALNNLGA